MLNYATLDALPEDTPQTIVVKTADAPSGGLSAALAAGIPLATAVDGSSGLAHLAQLERSGEVTGVFPVRTGPAPEQNNGRMGALWAMAAQATDNDETTATIVNLAPTVTVSNLVDELNHDPHVTYASRVPARYAAVLAPSLTGPNTQGSFQGQLTWNLERVGLRSVVSDTRWNRQSSSVRVGVLDTGVDENHPLLASGRVASYVHGQASTGAVSARDIVGHGTHVAGVISSLYSAANGIDGVYGGGVHVWKIFDDYPDYVARAGIYWYMVDPVLYRTALADCADKVDVINLSIGGTKPPDPQEAALFRLLLDRGITVVAAMGNERAAGSPTSYPAAIPGVIAVGATTRDDTVASFSNSGNHITVAAPGTGILSLLPTYAGQIGYRAAITNGRPAPGTPFPRDINQGAMDGTSMAAPHITGAVALLQANSPHRRTPQDVSDFLQVTATKVPSMAGARWTHDLGAGLLNLPRLIFAGRNL